jgi:hypothetical protein
MVSCFLLFDSFVRNRFEYSQIFLCGMSKTMRAQIIRLINLKRRVFDLAGTKNSSWTDRPRKSGQFEIKRFQVLSTLISIKHAISSDDKH